MNSRIGLLVIAVSIFVPSSGAVYGDSVNVALQANGGTATAISEGTYLGDTQHAWKAIDGDLSDGWSSSWDMPAWLMIEFDDTYQIEAVGAGWGSHQHTFTISLSLDSVNWTTVIGPQVSTNLEATEAYEYYDGFEAMDARYIRLDITSTSAPSSHIFQSSIRELEAYAVPEPATLSLLALGGMALLRRKRSA